MFVMVIETSRLLLVPISRDYAPDIFREFTSEITQYMYPKPAEKIEETYSFIDEAMEKNDRGEQLQMVILEKATNEFQGCIGLHEIKTKTPELGVWLKKAAQGLGYGREAVTELENWAQYNLDFDYLRYPVDKRNTQSRKIPESLGGLPGPEFKTKSLHGGELDQIEYRIIKK
ncbi:hypothetical protein A2872_00555 [Candidatus Gottesmanbacteria bacterium RIFCSPHIGHO2_01_FULL_42_12]|uniref:N-acetyltransferase domain-containing protein n=1 Tax=Candidatus Gottesmanbacteria bacterium RIFCSPHIGHO2_01_FULL_42_12 TaxID=1798377 RepID=A0A1F5Z333_9BACT|nr:MAG: hypothetical protein A2872_00555 [Candidatus Gottesmanbacteria bacterium RIFCSPHIGHO2_01_FULL_42_12]